MSQRSRRRHRRARGSVGKKVLLAFGVVLAVIAVAAGGAAIWALDVARSAPSIETLKPIDSGANSEIFAADGSSLGFVQTDIVREPVGIDEIPERLRTATIAIEDENFYEHDGVDYSAIARAGVDPAESILKCQERLYDVHLKDISALGDKNTPIEGGRGILDSRSILAALLKIKYQGLVGFEYEKDSKDPVPGLAESVGYIKGLLAGMR